MRILIVEDEERIAELVCKGLAHAGFTTDSVRRMEDAHEALTTLSYDTAVLDLGLPEGHGIEVIEDLRSHCNTIPIMF